MIKLNMSDVISVLNMCKPYLIAIAVILVVGIVAEVMCKKMENPKRKLVRGNAILAMVLGVVIVANLICTGPMSTLLTLSTQAAETVSDETTEQSNEDCRTIAAEGTVLLENDGVLPLKDTKNINVFGWASVNPIYGGSGAGALNDLYDRVTMLEGLEDAGFKLNSELTDLYTNYGKERADYGSDWSLPEVPAEEYSDELIENAKEFSDTAIVTIARWGGEGSDLPTDMSSVSYTNNSDSYNDFETGQHYLELSHTEKNMINLVCENFEHVILVYDGLSTFELGFVEDYPQIQGILWCAGPGQTGFDSLGKIISGEVNPSGKTSDTFLYDLTETPTWNNFGDFKYDNMDEFKIDESDPYVGGSVPTFVNYVEGIYVGYRFYETAAQEGFLDYDKVVKYPFGYGLSYTDFTQELESSSMENGEITLNVKVTNTGDIAGKDVVEVYYNPPYTNGGIEKSTANLIGYEKTNELKPGESQTVTISFTAEDMASYDYLENGCYVLEAGDYEISINSDSHNVIDSVTYTVDEDIVYDEANPRSTDLTAAVNQFGYVDGHLTYLSRKDGFKNYDETTAAPASLSMPEDLKEGFIVTSNYEMPEIPDAEMPVTGADNGMKLAELRGADYDDERWETLLDQLTIDEMQNMIAHAGFQTAEAKSVEKVATVDCDGPSAVSNNFTGAGSVGFPSNVMIACTWNKDLAHTYGYDMGKMATELGCSGWYAPSMNLHRSAFGGRTYEYPSEDPILAGTMSAQAVNGAAENGVYAYMKHFAMNEQETNRWIMICTWSNEQAMRELYLKSFEICVKNSNITAAMSSFNYIGNVWAGGNYELQTTLLRDEWGFKGFVETDYFAGAFNMNADQVIATGGSCCLSTFDVGANFVTDTSDPSTVQYMRTACKNIMYTVVNSNAYADETSLTLALWMKIMVGVDVAVAVILILLEVVLVKKYKKRKSVLIVVE